MDQSKLRYDTENVNLEIQDINENQENLEIHDTMENREIKEDQENQDNIEDQEKQQNQENKENKEKQNDKEKQENQDDEERQENQNDKEKQDDEEKQENQNDKEKQDDEEKQENQDDKENKDDPRLAKVKNGLVDSVVYINETLKNIKDWDELMDLKKESKEENEENEEKSIEEPCIDNIFIFISFGVVFCIINLIGVQTSIIILNSLFNELVEEFKLWLNGTPRKYNFYQRIEINTYRNLPEINVVMITSSIGIIFLKNFGFYCSIITLQLISSVSFFLIFLLFEFHKNDQLLENYTRLEMVVLVLAYILLSFIVGCSSTISLKEYFNIDTKVFSGKKNEDKGQKIAFYFFSGLALICTIVFHRQIFKHYRPITKKMNLIWIAIICASTFLISVIFHILFMIPVKVKKKNPEKEKSNKNKIENKSALFNKRIPFEIKNENEPEQELNDLNQAIDINDKYMKSLTNSYSGPKTENELLKKAKTFQNPTIKKEKKINYFTKICTLCGYIYLQKDSKDEHICICYYYSDKCTWFKETICNFDVIAPFLIELYCQISVIGYKLILTEKLLDDFSYTKNMKYFLALFFISVSLASVFIPADSDIIDNEKKKKKFNLSFSQNFLWLLQGIVFTFTIFILLSSACYCMEMSITKKRWDYIYMVGFGAFKTMDLMLLSFYDFFDNSDIFNTTLAITFEKLLWMIIEAIIYSMDISKKTLVSIQIVSSSFAVVLLIIYFCYHCYTECKNCCCCRGC